MTTYLAEYGVHPQACGSFEEFINSKSDLSLAVAPLASGFALPDEGWAVVTEAELYAGTVRRRGRGREKPTSVEGMLRDLSELKIGDPVVHAQHGIGRYQGLVELDLGEGRNEFLLLEYDGGDKLYVPVSQLAVISRYSGAQAEAAPLHKLGSGQWDKRSRARRETGARHRGRAARALRPARRAPGPRLRAQPARPGCLRRRLRLRGDRRPGRRDRGGGQGHGRGQADGPPDLRRRRLRQDRGRAARGVRRGRRPQAGGDPLSDHAARRAALPDLLRSLRRLAGGDRRALQIQDFETGQ